MKINEIMTNTVNRVAPDTEINAAAQMMREDDIGVLPVEQDDKLIGMVTDRDIVTRILGTGKDATQSRVSDAMSKQTLYCFDDEEVKSVAQNMSENQVRRMPVVNRDKRLVGIVSLGDIACHTQADVSGEALQGVSEELGG